MRLGITMNFQHSFFSSGLSQTVLSLGEIYRIQGYDVVFINTADKERVWWDDLLNMKDAWNSIHISALEGAGVDYVIEVGSHVLTVAQRTLIAKKCVWLSRKAPLFHDIEAEDAQTLDEFVQQTRDVMLARRLINERIAPRTIVAWRDVEQEYARRKAEFNPQPMIIIGRIRLNVTTDAAMVTQVKESIAAGKTFSAIALELKLPDGGRWNRFDLPPEGIKGTQLGDALKERLDGLAIDAMSEPLLQPGFITWLTVMTIDQPVARSIFDREVQLQLQAELKSRRTIIERERYISTLRSRWVTDDIGEMERRLLEIAVERYWR